MTIQTIKGQFEVIGSFAIKRRKEFYLIGELKSGRIQKNWFVQINLNNSLTISLRISEIEEVKISGEKKNHELLIISGEEEMIDLLIGLNIGNELIDVTIEE